MKEEQQAEARNTNVSRKIEMGRVEADDRESAGWRRAVAGRRALLLALEEGPPLQDLERAVELGIEFPRRAGTVEHRPG